MHRSAPLTRPLCCAVAGSDAVRCCSAAVLLCFCPCRVSSLSCQSRSLFLVALVALLPAVAVLAQGSARLLVQKSLDHHTSMPHNFAINSPINVSITIINAGDASAYDLVLEDAWGQTGMFEVEAGKGTGQSKRDKCALYVGPCASLIVCSVPLPSHRSACRWLLSLRPSTAQSDGVASLQWR